MSKVSINRLLARNKELATLSPIQQKIIKLFDKMDRRRALQQHIDRNSNTI